MIEQLFFELIQVSIGSREGLSKTPTKKEWVKLYQMAEKQSLIGICFAGIRKLGGDADEGFANIGMPEMLYLTWMGTAASIQMRNEQINQQCVELQERLAADGFRSCILKGQGVATLYNLNPNINPDDNNDLSGLRQPGDIDIWMEGGFEKIMEWAKTNYSVKDFNQHHVDIDVFEDTAVEAHFVPANLANPFKNRALHKYFDAELLRQCSNKRTLSSGREIACASVDFNLVFILIHIYHHLFTEGVGLRQVMDYYFVLKTRNNDNPNLNPNLNVNHNREVIALFEQFGLMRFASALMWVIKTVFVGHDNDNLNVNLYEDFFLGIEPNEEDGRLLLEEIMRSGNFGKQDSRMDGIYTNKLKSFFVINMKSLRFSRFDRWAWFWTPISRVQGKIWKYSRIK